MAIWNIVPTCDDPMSCYTLVAIAIIVAVGATAFGLLLKWNMKEFKKFSDALYGHDSYIGTTNEVINKIHVDIAVQKSSQADIKESLADIKAGIADINKQLRERN